MLSRWLFARLRTAEAALQAGRLDEAFARLIDAADRDERQQREMTARLGQALLARARLAAQAGRYRESLADLDRLGTLGAITDDARTLRARVEAEIAAGNVRQAGDEAAARRAADALQAGRLDSARAEVDRLGDPRRREELREQLDARVRRGDALLEQAVAALKRGDVLAACRHWDDVCTRHGLTPQASAVGHDVAAALRQAVIEWFDGGLLDRVRTAAGLAARLRAHAPSLKESEKLAEMARRAGEQLSAMDLVRLRETLLRLRAAAPQARWAANVLAGVDRMLALHGELLAGPLGLVASGFEKTSDNRIPRADGMPHTDGNERSAGLERPLLLLIDGTGSAALFASERLKIGRAGGSVNVDIPLPADLNSHHADLVRSGEDYFLTAHGPTRVNGREVTRTLLHDGDRILFGTTGKVTFRRASVRSETAVLVLGDRCRMAQDVSRVVLFRETCLVGPGGGAHLETREGDARVVLFDRDGRLWARLTARDQRPAGPAQALPTGQPIEMGDLRLTVKSYDPGALRATA